MDALIETDSLTGLPLAWARTTSGRHQHMEISVLPGSGLVSIDVRDFAGFNRLYGRRAGDALLVALAEALRESLGESARLFRLGGDEFIAFLPLSRQIPADIARTANASLATRSMPPVVFSIVATEVSVAENWLSAYSRLDHARRVAHDSPNRLVRV